MVTAMSEALEHPQLCCGVSFVRLSACISCFWGRSFHLSEAFEGIVLLCCSCPLDWFWVKWAYTLCFFLNSTTDRNFIAIILALHVCNIEPSQERQLHSIEH